MTFTKNKPSLRAGNRLVLAALLGSALLGGCATSTNPDVIPRNQAQRAQNIISGTIVSIRPVTIEGSQSGVGATAGAIIGATAGSSVGGRREHLVVGVLGAVLGGLAGHAIEKATTSDQAVEMVINLNNGRRVVIVQPEGAQGLMAGDRVNAIGNGDSYRVTRDTGR